LSSSSEITAALSLRRGDGGRVGGERIALLEAVGELGSISAAAKKLGLSYKGAWDAAQALNNLFDAPLIETRTGGAGGGQAGLTPRGRAVVAAFRRVEDELATTLARLQSGLADAPDADLGTLFWSLGMKTSARNALRGVVEHVTDGAVSAEVTLRIADGLTITAVVTRKSVAELGLVPGKPAIALIKSSFVTLAIGERIPRRGDRARGWAGEQRDRAGRGGRQEPDRDGDAGERSGPGPGGRRGGDGADQGAARDFGGGVRGW
jgi:molybdate transport system regulatory protein